LSVVSVVRDRTNSVSYEDIPMAEVEKIERSLIEDDGVSVENANPEVFALNAKICDFGLSGISSVMVGRAVQNPVWVAPEVLKGENMISKADLPKTDVYSFGVILWEIVTRAEFFGEEKFMSNIEEKVMNGERPPIPIECPFELSTLISRAWHQEPSSRPSFPEICEMLEGIKKNMKF